MKRDQQREGALVSGPGGDAPGAADEFARHWIARLAGGDMTEADFAALAAWRAQDAAHDAAFLSARRVWWRAGGHEHAFRAQQKAAARRRAWRRAGAALAACLALAVALPLALDAPVSGILGFGGAGFVADRGAPRRVALADGTVAWLDAGAAMDFKAAGGMRRVTLRRGAAFFQVAHDAARPFQVQVGGGVATDIGTAFAVRLQGQDAVVSVTQGRIRVEAGGQGAVLAAGAEAGWSGGRLLAAHGFDPDRRLAWRQGRLVVDGEPLAAALAEIGRYRRGYVLLLDGAAGARRVSGVFSTRDTDAAIGLLAGAQGLRVTRLTPLLTILS